MHFYENAILPALKISPDIAHCQAGNYLCPVTVNTLPVTDILNFVDTVFPLISTAGTYLISKLYDAKLIGGRCFKEGVTYLKVRPLILK